MPGVIVLSAAFVSVAGLCAGLVATYRHRSRRLVTAASALGLTHDPEQRTLEGRVAGRAVGAGPAPVVRSLAYELRLRQMSSNGGNIFRVAAALEPPLDLGLVVERRTLFSTDAAIFPGDLRFAIRADEPSRPRALLGPAVRELLARQTKRGCKVWLGDGGVLIEPNRSPSAPELIALLECSARIANELEERRESIPAAQPVAAILESWQTLAAERGLSVRMNPLRLESAEQEACAERLRQDRYDMVATVRFVPPLDIDLVGKSTHNVGLAIGSARDVTSGDLDFDTVYDLQARDEAELRAVLGPELRRSLLELAVNYQVSLDDRGITLRTELGPASALGAMLDRAGAVRRLLGRSRARFVYR